MSSLSLRSSTRSGADGVGARRTPAEAWDARRVFIANLVVLGVAACFALLYRFAAALFILFAGMALGMVSATTRGGFLHVLPIIALLLAFARIVQVRRSAESR